MMIITTTTAAAAAAYLLEYLVHSYLLFPAAPSPKISVLNSLSE
jgi:hypothetical protein